MGAPQVFPGVEAFAEGDFTDEVMGYSGAVGLGGLSGEDGEAVVDLERIRAHDFRVPTARECEGEGGLA